MEGIIIRVGHKPFPINVPRKSEVGLGLPYQLFFLFFSCYSKNTLQVVKHPSHTQKKAFYDNDNNLFLSAMMRYPYHLTMFLEFINVFCVTFTPNNSKYYLLSLYISVYNKQDQRFSFPFLYASWLKYETSEVKDEAV